MSSQYYNSEFQDVVSEIQKIGLLEKPPEDILLRGTNYDKQLFFLFHYQNLYLRYKECIRRLSSVYDNFLHPQKREDMKMILEKLIIRFVQVAGLLVKQRGEYCDFTNTLIDLKRTPDHLVCPIPPFFREDSLNDEKSLMIQRLFDYVQKKFGKTDAEVSDGEERKQIEVRGGMDIESAVRIIQVNERGRQGRHFYKVKMNIKKKEKFLAKNIDLSDDTQEQLKQRSALKIQSLFRGFLVRRRVRKMREAEKVFLGMRQSAKSKKKDKLDKIRLEEHRMERKLQQKQYSLELENARKYQKKYIRKILGPEIMEEMYFNILEKFFQYSRKVDKPEFPSEKDGGSLVFMRNVEESDEKGKEKFDNIKKQAAENKKKKDAKSDGNKDKKNKKKKDKKKKDKNGKKGKDKKATKKKEENGVTDSGIDKLSTFESIDTYLTKWHQQNLQDPSPNKGDDGIVDKLVKQSSVRKQGEKKDIDKFDMEVLKKKILNGDNDSPGLRELFRKKVDSKVRQQLKHLKLVKSGGRSRKQKGKNRKKNKNNNKNKGKDAKTTSTQPVIINGKKVMKKLTPEELEKYKAEQAQIEEHTNLNALLCYLCTNKIFLKAPKNRELTLSSFQGEFSYDASMDTPTPSLGQLKQTVGDFILSCGSDAIYKGCGSKTNSILFYGPPNTGKKLMIRIIRDTLGACWFDLCNDKLVGAGFSDTKGQIGLIKLVFEIAQKTSPSIIFMDKIETIFGKKKKKSKLIKCLQAELKKVQGKSRVFFIAKCSKIGLLDRKAAQGFFNKILYCPLPDYGNYLVLWKQFLVEKDESLESMNVQALSQVSNGFAAGDLKNCVDKVLTDRRIRKLKVQRPLACREFIGPLSKITPCLGSELEVYEVFTKSLPRKYRKYYNVDVQKDLEKEKKPVVEEDDKKEKKKKKNKNKRRS